MLTPATLRTSIDNLLDTVLEAGLAILRQPVVCRGSWRRTQVTWPILMRSDVVTAYGTVDEYMAQLDCMAYSAILLDGSIVQLEYGMDAGAIVSHRLAFYPCPFQIDADLLEEFALREVIEASESFDLVRLRTPVRFDFAPEAERDDHSASHLHFNHEECRVAVSAPLAPAGFMRFIVRNFFPSEWAAKEVLRQLPVPQWSRSIRPVDEAEWHLNQRAQPRHPASVAIR